jgi:hypothetical protein
MILVPGETGLCSGDGYRIVDTLGVDVGGVIIDRVNDDTDTSFFGDNYLATTATPGVFEALAQLVEASFGDRVFLVSKCGQRVQDKTVAWLAHHSFYERTGISPDHVRFCRERSEKAAIASELGLTHFVDDRLEVLGYLETVDKLYLFQPRDKEVQKYRKHLHRVQVVQSWAEVSAAILDQAT